MSLRDLSALIHYSASQISKVERGCRVPSSDLAQACDDELGAAGELSRLAAEERQRHCEHSRGRIASPLQLLLLLRLIRPTEHGHDCLMCGGAILPHPRGMLTEPVGNTRALPLAGAGQE